MAHDIDKDKDDDTEETRKPLRRNAPRFGPFVTIAAAILMLFGAVSRFGKTSEAGLWPNFDSLAANYIGAANPAAAPAGATVVTIGTLPAAASADAQRQRGMRLDMRAMPPPRGDFDLDEYRQRQNDPQAMPLLSVPGTAPIENNEPPAKRFDPLPEAKPAAPEERAIATYTVSNGDNWVKIGKATGKRWQDIQHANPESRNGLRVGMKLILP
jgi:hypothetical protein